MVWEAFNQWWVDNIAVYGDDNLLLWGNLIVITGATILAGIVFTPIEYSGWFEKYRIVWSKGMEEKRAPTAFHIKKILKYSLPNYFGVVFLFCFIGYPFMKLRGWTGQGPIPSPLAVVVRFCLFMLFEDFFGYWIHRFMHTPLVFKHIHAVHHKYHIPFYLTTLYMHPGEIINMGMAVAIGPMALGTHILVHWLWVVYRIFDTYGQHSGFQFPYDFRRYLGISDGRHHDSHHAFVKANYGFSTTYFDKLFGTYKSLDTAFIRGEYDERINPALKAANEKKKKMSEQQPAQEVKAKQG